MAPQNDEYPIGTNSFASARLHLQHYWAQSVCGFLVHPDIPIPDGAKIADIATGTGIYPISLSRDLPPSVHIDGFDITDAQFPPREWLPTNVSLQKLDILGEVPSHLRGQYDFISLRYFAFMVRNNDPTVVLENMRSMLKPGGYLQWLEPDFENIKTFNANPAIAAPAHDKFHAVWLQINHTSGRSTRWLRELPDICRSAGMQDARLILPELVPALRPVVGATIVGLCEEFLQNIIETRGSGPDVGSGEEMREIIRGVRKEFQEGSTSDYQLYLLVARQ